MPLCRLTLVLLHALMHKYAIPKAAQMPMMVKTENPMDGKWSSKKCVPDDVSIN